MSGSSESLGQSSSSPLGSPPALGQTNNGVACPLTPEPFGSTTIFGAQTRGSSVFGGTPIGGFGAAQSSSSTATFGASSSPASGTSVPTFGSPSSSSRRSSVFGQKPGFVGSGSTPTFGSRCSAAGVSRPPVFESLSAYAASKPDSGSASRTPFGTSSTQAFGVPFSFGSTPIGSSSSATGASRPLVFESLSAYGASNPESGSAHRPPFGTSSTQAFGVPFSFGSPPTFDSSGSATGVSRLLIFESLSAYGASNPDSGSAHRPPFGTSSTQAFGVPFSFGSTPTFGSSGSATGVSRPQQAYESFSAYDASNRVAVSSGETPFGPSSTRAFGVPFRFVDTPAFGAQSSPFGAQANRPTFGSQNGASGVAMHTPSSRGDSGSGTKPVGGQELK